MELYNNNIIIRDRTGVARVILDDISCTPPKRTSDINVRIQKPTASVFDESLIKWSHQWVYYCNLAFFDDGTEASNQASH
ncbi:hypothetical protein [Xenorhabdus taiwanensis]|uniref:Uncharacterized protein n=1 Tax=Xenorhabdus taiwanensis TaxID=3085177 RepID=A0ABM8JXC3_9GAMM|nr:hypothetical protein TCT1_22690 [Xenorhabdus sp. TCT-1]